MGQWSIDVESSPGVMLLKLVGSFEPAEIADVVRAHNQTIDAYHGADYRVLVDLRDMAPLSQEAAEELRAAKAYSASRPNFRGSAVLVTSSMVAMQHRRTSKEGGVLDTELISDNEAACWQHLKRVRRDKGG